MMNPRRNGFTVIELMVAVLLSAVIMGAIYQTLIIQQKSSRQVSAAVSAQQTLRTGMQVLQAELRESGPLAGDLVRATPDSLTFRVLRKTAFACGQVAGLPFIDVYTMGAPFVTGDSVSVYASHVATQSADDSVAVAVVTNVGAANAVNCPSLAAVTPWSRMGTASQRLQLNVLSAGTTPNDVQVGDPIRSFERVTYGIYSKAGQWVLGRRTGASTDTTVALIGPLAPPANRGLVLTYFDTLNAQIATANLASSLRRVGRVNIRLRSEQRGSGVSGSGLYTDTLVSDVFLRGN